ncbi:MAG: DUF1573 domain-containing protein [Candidatus Poribacteria bacterium]|nr:DUF1573 domain-containing protein [Candidatus Poribacteria bacterium]
MSKRTIITTIIIPVLLISGLIIVLINNPQAPSAELILTHQQIHFGTLPEWKGPVTRSLTAQNVGSNTLHIQSVHTGCSYAEITAPDAILADAEGTLHITINPETLPADETSATAIIFTDSPKTPTVSLRIIATAKRFATLISDVCEFGNILPETKHQKTLTLTVNAPLNTSDIRLLPSSHPRLTWEMTSDRSLITVQLGPLKDRGHFSSLLTVAFPNERTLTLPVTAKVIAPVIAQPERLIYEIAAPGTQPSLEFTLSGATPFKVLKITAPAALSVVDVDNTDTSPRKRLKVVWNVPSTPDPLREEIQVLTTADPLPIHIPVYGFIQNK